MLNADVQLNKVLTFHTPINRTVKACDHTHLYVGRHVVGIAWLAQGELHQQQHAPLELRWAMFTLCSNHHLAGTFHADKLDEHLLW